MTIRKNRDITEIKNMLLEMSGLVEEAVRSAVLACQKQDAELANRVIESDSEIDKIELNIDSMVLKTLALQQPMAVDLRFLTSAMQIAKQLERVGDHAVNMAEQLATFVKKSDIIDLSSPALKDMASAAIKMLGNSINAFVYSDAGMAYEILKKDKDVDDLYALVLNEEIDSMGLNKEEIRSGVYHIILALNIERIADLATNIAEDVIFMVEGKLVRHSKNLSPFPVKGDTEASTSGDIEASNVCSSKQGKRREPLECLENHAKQISQCMEHAVAGVLAYIDNNEELFKKAITNVNEIEHAADLIKRNVRAHIPKGIIMPIDKFELFLYLNEQDAIANTAEDVIEWLTYKKMEIHVTLRGHLDNLLKKCLGITQMLLPILNAARTFFETGDEEVRKHIKESIYKLRVQEHEADLMEHELKRKVFDLNLDPLKTFYLIRLIELIGKTADRAENAADIMRSMVAR
ncbi:MAG: phosphate signaling complex protein PhoU [Dissulfurimicrobium sp.]|uniref:phosphate signaling complex protein PhoU n=1 Tax=Dissulfurimicrobium sp. TaxID=2022436 RepID=UPI004049567C